MRREKTMDTLIRSIMIKSKRKMDAKVAQFGLTTQQARVLGFLNDNAANEIIQKIFSESSKHVVQVSLASFKDSRKSN